MGEGSRRAVAALERIAAALERQADAAEKLNGLAAEQQEAVLPEPPDVSEFVDALQCPHCRTFNPYTRTPAAEGNMSDFVWATRCSACGGSIYALPVGFRIVGSVEDARAMLATTQEEHHA